MSKPVTIPNAFQAQAGPIPLSQLDADFTAVAAAINDTGSYSNYFADSSGAANQITITVNAPLTFAYVTGIALQVKLALTNTSTTVNINVNALGNRTVILNDGSAPPIGSLTANTILDLMFDGASFRVLGQRATSTVTTGLFGDGTAGAPSISFAADTDTGFYRVAANDFAAVTGGAIRMEWTSTSVVSSLPILNQNGTAGAPAYAFSGDTTSGMHSVGLGTLRFSVGGTLLLAMASSGVALQTGVMFAPDGSAGAPAFTFNGDTDTGLFRVGANSLGAATGGVKGFTLDQVSAGNPRATFNVGDGTNAAEAITVNNAANTINLFLVKGAGQVQTVDGSAGAPTYSFLLDTDTGFYRVAANDFAAVTGGAIRMEWTSTSVVSSLPILNQNGTAGAPAYAFSGDSLTGFYRDTTNQIAIALGGVTAGQIAQGSYTGTLTGCTTSPTATINYQRVGKLVILEIPASGVTGTSNTNTMTITGAPAIIRPSGVTGMITACGDVTNNGADDNATVHLVTMNSAGTLTFYRANSNPATWTAANTKGIGLLGMTLSYLIT